MMSVKECLEKGLLKEDKPDRNKAQRSVQKAAKKAEKAAKLLKAGFPEEALVTAYSSMFHAARAVLFKDGFKERSHYAVYVYLKEKCGGKIEKRFLVYLDYLRQERHDVVYSLEEPGVREEEVRESISMAREFMEAVKKLL